MSSIESGATYKIVNYKSGTVLDLSSSNYVSVAGYSFHGGDNQLWYLTDTGDGWTLKNVGIDRYLSIDGDPGDGTAVVGSEYEYRWAIKFDESDDSAHRIFVLNEHYVVDLSDHGNASPGTAVTLWGSWKDGMNQAWRFEQA